MVSLLQVPSSAASTSSPSIFIQRVSLVPEFVAFSPKTIYIYEINYGYQAMIRAGFPPKMSPIRLYSSLQASLLGYDFDHMFIKINIYLPHHPIFSLTLSLKL